MSEYQYYEFQTLDRRLGEKEMQELRSFSSRATITPTSFVNEYSYGSFKGHEDAWMEKYFDASLYLANWGTHRLQFRLPAKLIPGEVVRLYCLGDAASVREKSGHLIFKFVSQNEEGGGWVQGQGILSSLIALRADLGRGDLRALYLGWLLCAQEGELDEETTEPPVPANLGQLTGALSSLSDFLRLDPDLLAVAAEASPDTVLAPAQEGEVAAWIASLPAKEKDEVLVRLMAGDDPHLGTDLCARFERQRATEEPVVGPPRRTVGALLAAADAHAEQRTRAEARQAALAKAKQERLAAAEREKHLNSLVGREEELWTEIETLIATKQAKSYDLVVQHLADLRDLAARQANETEFRKRLRVLRQVHARKATLMARLAQVEPVP